MFFLAIFIPININIYLTIRYFLSRAEYKYLFVEKVNTWSRLFLLNRSIGFVGTGLPSVQIERN